MIYINQFENMELFSLHSIDLVISHAMRWLSEKIPHAPL